MERKFPMKSMENYEPFVGKLRFFVNKKIAIESKDPKKNIKPFRPFQLVQDRYQLSSQLCSWDARRAQGSTLQTVQTRGLKTWQKKTMKTAKFRSIHKKKQLETSVSS